MIMLIQQQQPESRRRRRCLYQQHKCRQQQQHPDHHHHHQQQQQQRIRIRRQRSSSSSLSSSLSNQLLFVLGTILASGSQPTLVFSSAQYQDTNTTTTLDDYSNDNYNTTSFDDYDNSTTTYFDSTITNTTAAIPNDDSTTTNTTDDTIIMPTNTSSTTDNTTTTILTTNTTTTTTTNTTTNSTSDDDDGGRIVGGIAVTNPLAYPFYAYTSGNLLCGGTVLWADLILSAAHCNDAWTAGGGVWVGGLNRQTKLGATYYTIKKQIVHPDYNPKKGLNDIMLIQINGYIAGPYVELNTNSLLPTAGSALTAIGYGQLSENGIVATILQRVTVNTATTTDCTTYYKKYGFDTNKQVCNVSGGGKDTCGGDSGGPVFMDGTVKQIGIVSYGTGCARANVPAVNTRVSYYNTWIQSTMCSTTSYTPTTCPTPPPKPRNNTCVKSRKRCYRNTDCCSNVCYGVSSILKRCL